MQLPSAHNLSDMSWASLKKAKKELDASKASSNQKKRPLSSAIEREPPYKHSLLGSANNPAPVRPASTSALLAPFNQISKSILEQKKQSQSNASAGRLQPGELDPRLPADFEESSVKAAPTIMHGRLKAKVHVWASFVVSALVLSWITSGLDLRWKDIAPAPCVFSNHKSATGDVEFVTKAVAELCASQAAAIAVSPLLCILPLGVVTRAGTNKQRLIFDARYINEHLEVPKFKYETLSQLQQVLAPNDYMFVIDLKSGFHHLDMHPSAYPYLGFEWQGQQYHFKQLPFGLATAPWAFTKLTRELLRAWRSRGFRCTGYVDDFLHAAPSAHTALDQRTQALQLLSDCNCVVNLPKSDPTPLQRKQYIGAEVDTIRGALLIPTDKKQRLLALLDQVLDAKRTSVRAVERVVGHIMSLSFSFGTISMLESRELARWSSSMLKAHAHRRDARDMHFQLTSAAQQELRFWKNALVQFEGVKPLWREPFVHTVIRTDAAGASTYTFGGWGGWAKFNGRMLIASGRWNAPTALTSSTALELEAMRRTLESFGADGKLDGQRILILSDNDAAQCIVNKGGSMAPQAHEVVRKILWWALLRHIDLHAEWIPREDNVFADKLSKAVYSCDWKLNPDVFHGLAQRFGPFRTDLFASDTNAQLPRFFSMHHAPGTAGVNAFAQAWGQREWCNPPFAIIGRVVNHAERCHASMCMIVPFWPSASWWHGLVLDAMRFRPFVHACIVLPKRPDLFLGAAWGHTQAVTSPAWQTLALWLDFAQPNTGATPIPGMLRC